MSKKNFYHKYPEKFDVIVIGAGHAGCEAALASAKMGCYTLLLTITLDTIAQMSCNPAIGGIAKGHLTREIDALGGEMAFNIDQTGIQFRMLNTSKGPAVQSPRAQADKKSYQLRMKSVLEKQGNLIVIQDMAEDIIIENNIYKGIITKRGILFNSKTLVISTGTFLRGLIHIGLVNYSSGRDGEFASMNLSASLKKPGLKMGRLKTGTPARVNKNSIDFKSLNKQDGDKDPIPFSFRTEQIERRQVSCYITHTNEKTHRIIRKNLDKSPLYGPKKIIKGVGARYCPSIEDKVVKFPDRKSHHIFLEPEGYDTAEVYVNGISTSLPAHVQDAMMRTIPGLENVSIMRYGYGIEYDFVYPFQLHPTLETKKIKNLFLAGQINGTSGYEEAGAQGLIAGINASLRVKRKKKFVMARTDGYIGVLIDDLITKNIREPYRMFTSLAEYRLLLRCDNADRRLMEYGYKLGLLEKEVYEKMLDKKQIIKKQINEMSKKYLSLSILKKSGFKNINPKAELSLKHFLRRPEIKFKDICRIDNDLNKLSREIQEGIEIEIKYEGYIQRDLGSIQQFKKMEKRILPEDIDYKKITELSIEAREKLSKVRPLSLGQASRISGVRNSDITVLMLYLNKLKKKSNKKK